MQQDFNSNNKPLPFISPKYFTTNAKTAEKEKKWKSKLRKMASFSVKSTSSDKLNKRKSVFGLFDQSEQDSKASSSTTLRNSQNLKRASLQKPYLPPSKPKTLSVTLSDFSKVGLIGKGDVGKVYLVQDASKKQYALKILNKHEMKERNKLKRVLAEQEILKACNHPFIVSLLHSFQDSENLYFCLEYCEGGEFFRLLQSLPNKRLLEKEAQFYGAEVLLALEYLHLMGFIYRDLKPENILVHSSGHIMLSDFDLSMPCLSTQAVEFKKGKINTSTMPSITNSFVGTEEYISPEIILGKGHSFSVDWWGFGILLYEMLTSKTPFKGVNRRETFHNVLYNKVDTKGLSKEASFVITKLLEKDWKKRVRGGAGEIRDWSFWKGIEWGRIRDSEPPYRGKGKLLREDLEDDKGDCFKKSFHLKQEEIKENKTGHFFEKFESMSLG